MFGSRPFSHIRKSFHVESKERVFIRFRMKCFLPQEDGIDWIPMLIISMIFFEIHTESVNAYFFQATTTSICLIMFAYNISISKVPLKMIDILASITKKL